MQAVNVLEASQPSRRLTIASIIAWALIALALPLAALTLNALNFAGFPLGFWFAAQGAMMGLAALALVFTWKAGGTRSTEGVIGPLTFAGEVIASAGFIGFAGLIAQLGFDALSYPLGVAAGLALMTVLIAPAFASVPSASLPDFLSTRLDSAWPGRLALFIMAIASIFLLAADLRGLGLAVQAIAGLDRGNALLIATGAIGFTWFSVSVTDERQSRGLVYAMLLAAFSLPLVMMTVLQHRLPLPYWSYGFALQDVATIEQELIVRKLADFSALKPMTSPFLRLSNWNFAGIVLAIALGIAVLPQFLGRHLTRAAVSPGEAPRRAMLTTMLVAIFLCGLAPFAALTRVAIAELLQKGVSVSEVPAQLTFASSLGWLGICGEHSGSAAELAAACAKATGGGKGMLRLQDLTFESDAYLFSAARIAGIGEGLWTLLIIGALLAALIAGHAILAGFVAAAVTKGPENVRSGTHLEPAGGMIGALLLLAAFVAALNGRMDIPSWAADGLALVAATIFPAMVLALYWKRFNSAGAVAAMMAGLACAGLYIFGVRVFPVAFYELTGALSNAAPGVVRRYANLRTALDAAPDPVAHGDIASQLREQASLLANWWGLKPPASVLFALPAAFVAGIMATLLTPRRRAN